MSREPTRIDLLELDIDLRLTDLWREAADVTEWNLEVVAAFIRAAYGKGYCDALTEESPGSLCVEHGYRLPDAALRGARRRLAATASGDVGGLTQGASLAGLDCPVARQASPARLVIALLVAGVLAVFLLYTSIAGGGNASIAPSQLAGRTGEVQLAGKVVGPVRGDAHDGGLRFRMQDISGKSKASVVILYTGSVPDQFKVGRDIVVDGRLRKGTFVAEPGSMITKCPSKYVAKPSGEPS